VEVEPEVGGESNSVEALAADFTASQGGYLIEDMRAILLVCDYFQKTRSRPSDLHKRVQSDLSYKPLLTTKTPREKVYRNQLFNMN